MGAVRWLEGRPIDARAARATRLLLLLIALTSNGSDLTSVDYALTTPPAYRFPGSWLPEPPMWSIDGARWASIILWLASVGPKGWWTRAACVLTAAAYFFMCSGIANLALMHDSFAMLQATLLVGAIFPEDDSRSSKRGDLRSTGLPRKILILFNAGAFFGTGLAALRSSGLAWFSGGSVEAWVSSAPPHSARILPAMGTNNRAGIVGYGSPAPPRDCADTRKDAASDACTQRICATREATRASYGRG
mmetsp:Transcript_38424/g.121425  ORF Transcript_38424/g.121425 Transcript_38424/m.121425 type:complete len:248 (-) Transcript_38424:1202-1945(-)